MNKNNSSAVTELKGAKLVTWGKSLLSSLKLHKSSRAGIIVDKKGAPQLFVFDTPAFLDILSTIDEALVDRLSDKEYHSKTANPAGYLIDKIEARLPLDPQYVLSLKSAVDEANKKGWVPFSKILKNLGIK